MRHERLESLRFGREEEADEESGQAGGEVVDTTTDAASEANPMEAGAEAAHQRGEGGPAGCGEQVAAHEKPMEAGAEEAHQEKSGQAGGEVVAPTTTSWSRCEPDGGWRGGSSTGRAGGRRGGSTYHDG